ncbi:Ion channel [uncultured archaeon]|nr:Ion channel [uncultured archaeon]
MKVFDWLNVFNVSRLVAVLLFVAIFLDPFFLTIFLENKFLIGVIIIALLVTSITFGYDLVKKKLSGVTDLVRKYFFLSLSVILLFGVLYFIVFNLDHAAFKATYPLDAYRDPFYFSAVTFYTVGYGDIHPFDTAKIIAVLQMILGSMINLVVLALAIRKLKY